MIVGLKFNSIYQLKVFKKHTLCDKNPKSSTSSSIYGIQMITEGSLRWLKCILNSIQTPMYMYTYTDMHNNPSALSCSVLFLFWMYAGVNYTDTFYKTVYLTYSVNNNLEWHLWLERDVGVCDGSVPIYFVHTACVQFSAVYYQRFNWANSVLHYERGSDREGEEER